MIEPRQELIQEAHGLPNDLAEFLISLADRKPKDSPITEQVYRWASSNHSWKAEAGLGRCALARKDWKPALMHFQNALRTCKDEPTRAKLHINASVAADHNCMAETALFHARMARSEPDGFLQLFGLFEETGMFASAEEVARQGLLRWPDDHRLLFSRATVNLREGNFAEGWEDYEHRPSKLALDALMDEHQEWKGEPLDGKTILVIREQGFGDEIMFSRYLGELPKSAKVVVYAYPELARLFAQTYPFARIITSDAEAARVDLDYWTAMGSLPLRTRVTSNAESNYWQPPICKPFLGLHPARGSKLKVGLCWKGNPAHGRDSLRSMPFDEFRLLLDVPGCEFYSLQWNDTESGLPNLTDYGHDWADYLTDIAKLDLVISVDTGIAHLAAYWRTPTWILLRTPTDWRWRSGTTTSTWYPSACLFRDAPMPEIAECLARCAGKDIPFPTSHRQRESMWLFWERVFLWTAQ